jgi:subtilisin family serine protease
MKSLRIRSMLKTWLASLGLMGIVAVSVAQAQTTGNPTPNMHAGKHIADQYIVVLSPNVRDVRATARNLTQSSRGSVLHLYENAIKGFSARMSATAAQSLLNNPNVISVEQDQQISLNTTQNSAPWGLDRIDQVDRPLSFTYVYNTTGENVRAYIIDTGILSTHTDFGGRVLSGFSAISDGLGDTDCNGHGTHVAGTVGGNTWGVAKRVQLVPVRVLDCTGSGAMSGVIAGVDWVAGQAHRPAVANMSLGGGASSALDTAVAGAIAKGVSMVVAAGNSNDNACKYSPARAPDAITVGATTSSDARASYSNYGSCLDIFAPGSSIRSAWHTSDTETKTISGTSMASPHVAGVVALVLQENPEATPLAVVEHLKKIASVNKVTSSGTGSPNLLLYSLSGFSVQTLSPVTVSVTHLASRSIPNKTGWRAELTVTIGTFSSGSAEAVANATVAVEFQPGGTASCTTGTSGSCTVTSPNFKNTVSATDAAVRNVSGPNLVYDASPNYATSVKINK